MPACVRAVQAGRHFNQAQYDAANQKRWEECVARRKADDEAELVRKDDMEEMRDEFLVSTDRKYRRARLHDAVNAQLRLHHFALEDRRDR